MKRIFALPSAAHGGGKLIAKWQPKLANFLASAGNARVHIADRHGAKVKEMDLPNPCTGWLAWSSDGGLLAVIQDKSPSIILWDANTKETTQLDSGEKSKLTCLSWSSKGAILCVGTQKGNVLLYNHASARKIPCLGVHTGAVTDAAWSLNNILCLCSEDRTITVLNEGGNMLEQTRLSDESGLPSDIRVFEPAGGASDPKELTVSVVLNHRQLYLWKVSDSPIELEFQPKYGGIVSYAWFADKRVMLGFSSGFFVVISTHSKDIGQELHQTRNHRTKLTDAVVNRNLGKAATCGDDSIKIHDLANPNDVFGVIQLDDERGMLDTLAWSDDGQLLTVTLQSGALYTYLCKIQALGGAYGVRAVYLSTLDEVTSAMVDDSEAAVKLTTVIEPTFLACGRDHVAYGANNMAYFMALPEPNSGNALVPVTKEPRSYLSSVRVLHLNADYAAALCDGGKVELHWIQAPEDDSTPESILLPEKGAAAITTMNLTNHFCVYGDKEGGITFFVLDGWKVLSQFKHVIGIKQLFADPGGSRVVFVDDKDDVFVFNAVNDALYALHGYSAKGAIDVFWDSRPHDQGTFVVAQKDAITTFSVDVNHFLGARVTQAAATPRDPLLTPLVFFNGTLHCLTASGKLGGHVVSSHDAVVTPAARARDPKRATAQLIALHRFTEAVATATAAADPALWAQLCRATVDALDMATAAHVHRVCGLVGAARTLAALENIEDRNLLCGHVALLRNLVDKAQDFFLASSAPIEALTMHRDLLNWDKALQLASRFAPDQLPYISREYAAQQEIQGNYSQALSLFEQGVTSKATDAAHNTLCKAGTARALLRTGDIRGGTTLATELGDKALFRECGNILEQMNQPSEAAQLFELGGLSDRAVALYIKTKHWAKVTALLPTVNSPKLIVQYGKAREADGSFKDAAEAFEQAKDYDNFIRVCLQHLRDPDRAVKAVKLTGSIEGAKQVAKFFLDLGDHGSAIQFLILSNQSSDAFALAQQHNKMDLYAKYVGSSGSADDFGSVALVFERQGNLLEAGRFFVKAGEYAKAVRVLLQVPAADDAANVHIDLLIEAAGLAKDAAITKTVTAFLLGDEATEPKVPRAPKYLFNLYLALKQFPEAARTALVIAKVEREAGNYRHAHDLLLSMYRQLQGEHIRIPSEMAQDLLVLHSYLLVKAQLKRGDHLKGARLLNRVSSNISLFPAHMVNILTSTVIECHRSGLKNSSFNYSVVLMRPEFRSKIDAKYKDKIEKIVRKTDRAEELEPVAPCPYCAAAVPVTTLQCGSCQQVLPYCIVTGQHMVKDNWGCCPECSFPALYSEFVTFLADEDNTCPMCSVTLTADRVVNIADPSLVLARNKEAFAP